MGVLPDSATDKQSKIQSTFVRVEDKFLISKAEIGNLISLVSEHCKPAYLESGTNYTLVESLYFDSQRLDLYKNHFADLPERFKLRVRRYAPNGNWGEGSAFLEAKSKIKTEMGSIGTKKRFRIDPENLESLIQSGDVTLTQKLVSLNPNLGKADLLERTSFVNEIVKTYQLVPQLRVRYERLAYEGDGVRVTFDKNIEFKIMSPLPIDVPEKLRQLSFWAKASGMTNIFSNSDYFVCEVKYGQVIPMWLQNYFNSHGIQKVSFSKYCWGLTNVIVGQDSHFSGPREQLK